MLLRFITSNDYGHFEKWYFQQEDTDQDVQIQMFTKGDGALYCVDGPVTVNLVDAEESLY